MLNLDKNIIDLDEWSETKIILDSEPKRIVPILLLIILIIVMAFLGWSYFGEIDQYTKAVGVVRPGEDVITVSGVPGIIQKVYVKEGEKINKNDPLFLVNNGNIEIKNEEVIEQIEKTKEEIELLNEYKKGVLNQENSIKGNGAIAEKYKSELEKYLIKQNSLKEEMNILKEMIIDSSNYTSNQRKKLESESKKISNEIKTFKNLEQIIMDDKNIDIGNNKSAKSLYDQYLNDFNSVTIAYDNQINQLLLESEAQESEIEESETQEQKEINDYSKQIKELEDKKQNEIYSIQLNYQDQIITIIRNLESELRNIQLSGVQSNNNQYVIQLNQVSSIQKELEKETIASINEIKKQLELQLGTLESNYKLNDEELQLSEVRSPMDGIVEIEQPISEGNILQGGEKIISIIPENYEFYKIKIMVPSDEIGNIQIGSPIKFNFDSLTKKENKSIIGKVTYIRSDVVIDNQANLNYFIVESTVSTDVLKENNIDLKIGMTGQAYIVYDSKRIITYFLEKLNLM